MSRGGSVIPRSAIPRGGNASRHAVGWIVALLALVLLPGCVKLDAEVSIAADDTFSGEAVVAVHQDWAIGNGQDPHALQAILVEELAAAPEAGITSDAYDDEEYVGATLTFTDVPIERIEEATSGALTITSEAGGYEVAGRLEDLDTTAPGPAEGGTDGDEVPTPWVIDLSVTFPETVTDHDGTLVGRTVSWELEPGEDTFYATTAGSGFALPLPAPVLVFLVLVAGTGLWLFISRRRRRRQ